MPLEKRNAASELHEAGWRPGASAVVRMAAQLAQALAHLHAMGDLLGPRMPRPASTVMPPLEASHVHSNRCLL